MQSAFQPGSGSHNGNEQSQQNFASQSSPEPLSGPGIPHSTLHSHQMGQGASTPRDEAASSTQNSEPVIQNADGTPQGVNTPVEDDRATTTARLRRSRRLRNHIERFSDRWMPSESNPSARSRLSKLRPRLSRAEGSRSPSLRSELAERRRTMPSISRPIPVEEPSFTGDSGVDMMDISPVSTVVPQPQPQPQEQPAGDLAEMPSVRQTRMGRLRNSVSSWSELLGRPGRGLRTPTDSRRNSMLDPIDPMDLDMPQLPRLIPARPALVPDATTTAAADPAATRLSLIHI